MKNQTNNIRWLTSTLVLMGAIIFIAPLVHIDFPRKTAAVAAYEEELAREVSVLENDILALKDQYKGGQLDAVTYIVLSEDIRKQLRMQRQVNETLLKEKIDSQRVFGWESPRIFLIGFGIRLPYLLFSVIISLLIFRIRTRDRYLSRAFFFLQVLCYTIALYELVWCFWYSQDYPLETYRVAIIGICLLFAVFAINMVKYINKRARIHKGIISWLMDVLVVDAKKEARNPESYDTNVIKPTIKKLHERTR